MYYWKLSALSVCLLFSQLCSSGVDIIDRATVKKIGCRMILFGTGVSIVNNRKQSVYVENSNVAGSSFWVDQEIKPRQCLDLIFSGHDPRILRIYDDEDELLFETSLFVDPSRVANNLVFYGLPSGSISLSDMR